MILIAAMSGAMLIHFNWEIPVMAVGLKLKKLRSTY